MARSKSPPEHPLREAVSAINPEALFADGFDDAIIGVASRFGLEDVVAYDYDKVIGTLVKDGCT